MVYRFERRLPRRLRNLTLHGRNVVSLGFVVAVALHIADLRTVKMSHLQLTNRVGVPILHFPIIPLDVRDIGVVDIACEHDGVLAARQSRAVDGGLDASALSKLNSWRLPKLIKIK